MTCSNGYWTFHVQKQFWTCVQCNARAENLRSCQMFNHCDLDGIILLYFSLWLEQLITNREMVQRKYPKHHSPDPQPLILLLILGCGNPKHRLLQLEKLILLLRIICSWLIWLFLSLKLDLSIVTITVFIARVLPMCRLRYRIVNEGCYFRQSDKARYQWCTKKWIEWKLWCMW